MTVTIVVLSLAIVAMLLILGKEAELGLVVAVDEASRVNGVST